jgi:hypothetical protein
MDAKEKNANDGNHRVQMAVGELMLKGLGPAEVRLALTFFYKALNPAADGADDLESVVAESASCLDDFCLRRVSLAGNVVTAEFRQ